MRRFSVFLVLAAIVFGGVASFLWWRSRAGVSTDDAFVRSDVVQVSAEVAGRVVEVGVHENEHVEAGRLLVRLDDTEPRLRVAQAEANLAAAVADAKRAEESAAATRSELRVGEVRAADAARELERQQQLLNGGAAVQATLDKASTSAAVARQSVESARVGLSAARAAVEAAQARIPAAEAALDLARRELERTEIRAPCVGVASKAELQVGELVQRGQPVLAIVPDDRYVVANFKETDLPRIHVGDPVEIEVDALPGAPLEGRVDSVAAGTGAVFSLLPVDNASGNFVKVVQRVPVRVAFASAPPELQAGLSATVTVRSEPPR